MDVTLAFRQRLRIAAWTRYLFGIVGILLLGGLIGSDSAEELMAYVAITLLAFAPSALWLWAGTPGIPAWPVASAVYYVFYALPLLRGNLSANGLFTYSDWEILNAGATVSLFLLTATLAWWTIISTRGRRKVGSGADELSGKTVERIVFLGLGLGFGYFFLLSTLVGELGTYLGIVRSVTLTAAMVGCFLLGHARAAGLMRGYRWIAALVILAGILVLSTSTLYLVGGIMMVIIAMTGYAVTAKRVPWKSVGIALMFAAVLHAGKSEMRNRYWAKGDPQYSALSTPSRLVEWTTVGLQQITTNEKSASVVDRAALLHLLLRVQRLAPNYVPYLNGDSYALLPYMLVPRFVEGGKIASQAAMRMLNVRFGIQTEQASMTTSIGWGLIAEAYGNFGNFGVLVVAFLIGIFGGLLTRISEGRPAASILSLIAISGMVMLINLESDLSYFVVNFTQSTGALLILYLVISAIAARKGRRRRLRPAPVTRPGFQPANIR